MPATGTTYPMFSQSLAQKLVDLDSDTLKVMLLSAYTYDEAHQFLSQVKAAGTEAIDPDYTAGGLALTGVTWTRTGAVYKLDANDVSWASTVDAVAAVIYDDTPATEATKPVVGVINLDGSWGTVAVPAITWNAAGILTATAA